MIRCAVGTTRRPFRSKDVRYVLTPEQACRYLATLDIDNLLDEDDEESLRSWSMAVNRYVGKDALYKLHEGCGLKLVVKDKHEGLRRRSK